MPLIEVFNFRNTQLYLQHLSTLSVSDIISTWENCSIKLIFISRYKFRLIQDPSYIALKSNHGAEADMILNAFIFGVNRNTTGISLDKDFKKFITLEREFFLNEDESNLTQEQLHRRAEYFNFLTQNTIKFTRIYNLSEKTFYRIPTLGSKLNAIQKASLLKVEQLEKQTHGFFNEVDRRYEIFEKSFQDLSTELRQSRISFAEMDWDYFNDPFQLEGYPEAKEEFLRAVIAWFRENLHERKKILLWDKVPNTYLFIEEFIEELRREITPVQDAENQELKTVKTEPIIEEDYPKFIFASQNAYDFFCRIAQQATEPIQLGFLFRQLSEKEKPPMIVVNDAKFREWFNTQSFEIKLNDFTKTFDKARNKDRLWAYNVAKELFFKK